MNDPLADRHERALDEATRWFGRMKGPHSDADVAAFEAWRAAHPANEAAWARLGQRWDQSAFLANLASGRQRDLSRARHWTRNPAARAALAASVVFVVVAFWAGFRQAGSGIASKPAGIEIAAGDSGPRLVRVRDGSRILLDAATVIDIDYDTSARRIVLKQGRARFDVAHERSRPFLVEAGGGSVIAHGTLFDVGIGPAGVKVVLLRGSIEVTAERANDRSAPSRLLRPGQALVYRAAEPLPTPHPATTGDVAWGGTMVSFGGTPLADAVVLLNQRNERKVVLASQDLGALKMTGAFHGRDPYGFAEAVAAMFHLTLSTRPDGTLVLADRTTA